MPACPELTISHRVRVGDVAYGRPVGVVIARDGSLLVAYDVGNKIWRKLGHHAAAPDGGTSGRACGNNHALPPSVRVST